MQSMSASKKSLFFFFFNHLNFVPYDLDKIFHFLQIPVTEEEPSIVLHRASSIQEKQCIIVYNLCIILNVLINFSYIQVWFSILAVLHAIFSLHSTREN